MRALTTSKNNNNNNNKTTEIKEEDEKDEMHVNDEEDGNENYNTENNLIGKTIDEVEENDNDVYTPVNHQFDNLTEISNGEDELNEVANGYKTEVLHEDSYANKEME